MSVWHRHPGVRTGDQLTIGERAADKMRNGMGSWPFVFIFFGFMIAWAIGNSVFWLGGNSHRHGADPYPYVLLNLFLSALAGVQAAALLIAAKRADQISSEVALHTERNTDELKTLQQQNNDMTAAMHDLTQQLHDHLLSGPPGKYEAKPEDVPPFLRGTQ